MSTARPIMPADPSRLDPERVLAIADWIASGGLAGADEAQLLQGFCERLAELDIAIHRALVGVDVLHPKLSGLNVVWHGDTGAERTLYLRAEEEDMDALWEQSPFFAMTEAGETRFRQRLDGDEPLAGFPIFDELRGEGATDYLAYITPLGESASIGEMDSIYSSWTCDRPGGFRDDEIATLEALIRPFSLAFKGALADWMGASLIETYLGQDAGQRVLHGAINRGASQSIRAILWYSDLVGFTRIADTAPRDQLVALLNDYAECIVEAVNGQGGQVLKFMGDGVLSIFALDDPADACRRALDAADSATDAVSAMNARRVVAGLPVTTFHLALHLGEVLYGNIGSQDRLDFTVVGPAVNEVSRIEAMCQSLDRPVIVSAAFAEAATESRDRLVSLGRYALRGVRQPQELFTLDPGGS